MPCVLNSKVLITMKKVITIPAILIVLTLGLITCSKDCGSTLVTCSDTPPASELCDAAFNRWFYNQKKNKCEQISYSGCSQKGFETKQECEECECD